LTSQRWWAAALTGAAWLVHSAPVAAGAVEAEPLPVEWQTPAEAADFEATPSYDETLAFLHRLEAALPELRVESFGTSAAGRPLPLVIVAKERTFTPGEAAARGLPVVLVQSGIHAGEVDGKDATLMLLRDFALGRRLDLLDAGVLLFVPIYNVDGHERVSPWNRPNQNGPVRGMGFRTTADGHDLNRDFLKLETPEARALVALVNAWRPHLHVDNHVTDSVDHDWQLTWLVPEAPLIAAPVEGWLRRHFPPVLAATTRAGHRLGPYVDLVDGRDPTRGFATRITEPRYSTGYFALRNRPSILVETHSHKPFRERVLANRDFLAALLTEVARGGRELVAAVASAQLATAAAGQPGAPPTAVALDYEAGEADRHELPIYEWALEPSLVSGQPEVRYLSRRPRPIEVPWYHASRVAKSVARPRGYLLSPGWPQIERRVVDHGLRFERLTAPLELEVETLRVARPRFAASTRQGLTRVEADVARDRERRKVPAGTLWIPADQPDFDVAIQLLEPEAPDSLFAWGLLSTVLERKEYIDGFLLEPEARRLLADPAVAAEWGRALEDPAFAADTRARYLWWFARTPWWDETIGLLPYYRALGPLPR
jgi:hypothetical protein